MKVERVGDAGTRLLLVHGNDLCGAFYRPLAQRLGAGGLAVTLPTLPGFCGEPPLAEPGWQALGGALVDDREGHAFVAGHSLGALLALLVAARRPAGLRGLILLEPAIVTGPWLARRVARRYLGDVVRGDRDRFDNWNGAMRRVSDPARYPPAAIAQYLDCRRAADRATAEALFMTLPSLYPLPFERIEVPCLIIGGGAAGWRATLLQRRLRRALPDARRVVLPGAGHFLVHEDDAALAALILDFVRNENGTEPAARSREPNIATR